MNVTVIGTDRTNFFFLILHTGDKASLDRCGY